MVSRGAMAVAEAMAVGQSGQQLVLVCSLDSNICIIRRVVEVDLDSSSSWERTIRSCKESQDCYKIRTCWRVFYEYSFRIKVPITRAHVNTGSFLGVTVSVAPDSYKLMIYN